MLQLLKLIKYNREQTTCYYYFIKPKKRNNSTLYSVTFPISRLTAILLLIFFPFFFLNKKKRFLNLLYFTSIFSTLYTSLRIRVTMMWIYCKISGVYAFWFDPYHFIEVYISPKNPDSNCHLPIDSKNIKKKLLSACLLLNYRKFKNWLNYLKMLIFIWFKLLYKKNKKAWQIKN